GRADIHERPGDVVDDCELGPGGRRDRQARCRCQQNPATSLPLHHAHSIQVPLFSAKTKYPALERGPVGGTVQLSTPGKGPQGSFSPKECGGFSNGTKSWRSNGRKVNMFGFCLDF